MRVNPNPHRPKAVGGGRRVTDGAGFPVEEESRDLQEAPSPLPRHNQSQLNKETLTTLTLVEQVLQEIARLVKKEYG